MNITILKKKQLTFLIIFLTSLSLALIYSGGLAAFNLSLLAGLSFLFLMILLLSAAHSLILALSAAVETPDILLLHYRIFITLAALFLVIALMMVVLQNYNLKTMVLLVALFIAGISSLIITTTGLWAINKLLDKVGDKKEEIRYEDNSLKDIFNLMG